MSSPRAPKPPEPRSMPAPSEEELAVYRQIAQEMDAAPAQLMDFSHFADAGHWRLASPEDFMAELRMSRLDLMDIILF